jgi:hypothetical protein
MRVGCEEGGGGSVGSGSVGDGSMGGRTEDCNVRMGGSDRCTSVCCNI